MEKRRNKRILALVLIGIGATAMIGASSFAWFNRGTDISIGTGNDIPVKAGAHAAYYGGGDGSQSTPYIISTRTHLYNLAWLQYIGIYNKNGIQQLYFEVANDINMQDLTLPPIGTDQYPFLGNFNGNNKTISNLTISNADPTDSSVTDFGVAKPTDIPADATQPKIVGFFGVVGKLPSQTISYTSSIVSIKNITLNNLTVKSKTSQTLIGLAAGYVDGTMSGVKISGNSSLVLGESGKTYVSSDITKKLSDYALVGYSKQTQASAGYSQDLSEYYTFGGDTGTPAHEVGWGGSIEPGIVNRLIYDTYKQKLGNYDYFPDMQVGASKTNSVPKSGQASRDYNIIFTTPEKTTPNKTTSPTYYTKYLDPEFFDSPQNNLTTSGNATNGNVAYTHQSGSYFPLKFSDDKLSTSLDNTGYVVGSQGTTTTTTGYKSPITDAFYYSNLYNSIKNKPTASPAYADVETSTSRAAVNYRSLAFDDAELEILTYSTKDSAWYGIKDSHINNVAGNTYSSAFTKKTVSQLGFEKYNDSRNKLQTLLTDSPRIQGIQFNTYNEVSASNVLTVASGIKINGESKTNYDLPKGSIDFNLKSAGYINFFAGTYASGTKSLFSFFSLNQVFRSGSSISSIKKISKIYQNKYWSSSIPTSVSTNPKFFYQYSDNSFSNIVVGQNTRAATVSDADTSVGKNGLIFDATTILEGIIGQGSNGTINTPINNVLFYFEIPVNEGEYAMGMAPVLMNGSSVNTSYIGAHMIYLDIGANGDTIKSDEISAYSITTKTQGNVYPIGVDFAVASVGAIGGDSLGVSITSGKSGTVAFNLNSTGTTLTLTGGSISNYAFKGTKYNNGFTLSGTSPGNPDSPPVGGTRVLTIIVNSTTATITDVLSDGSGTISSSSYAISGRIGTITQDDILALSSALTLESLATLRSLTIAATLTRNTGSNSFTAAYTTASCSYENKIVDVTISNLGSSTIAVAVTSGYTFKVGGTPITTSFPA